MKKKLCPHIAVRSLKYILVLKHLKYSESIDTYAPFIIIHQLTIYHVLHLVSNPITKAFLSEFERKQMT